MIKNSIKSNNGVKARFFIITLFYILFFIGVYRTTQYYKYHIPVTITYSISSYDFYLDRLKERYVKTIKSVQETNQSKIYKNLTAIVPENKNLSRDAEGRVLVLAFTTFAGYDDKEGEDIVLQKDMWVTVVPELEQFCREQKIGVSLLPLRIEQLLGNPPGRWRTKRFIAFWAKPGDIFRPCADSEITDTECSIGYPQSPYITTSTEYKTWFEKQKTILYGEDGYPWTQLGYTYDWGDKNSTVGLSEFVVKQGAKISIHQIIPTNDFVIERCKVN